jgi:Protein of unknown function (DUF2934)
MDNLMQSSFYSMPRDPGVVRRPTQSEIAAVAYHLYLDQGSRNGHDLDDWFRAEQWLIQQLNEMAAPNYTPAEEPAQSTVGGVQPLDGREYPWARDKRGSPDREDIRRKTSPSRPASRQPRSGHHTGKESARNEFERFAGRR